MSYGGDWRVMEKIGDFGIRDGKRSYCHEGVDQCDDLKIVRGVIDN